jgi:hypothetical protein
MVQVTPLKIISLLFSEGVTSYKCTFDNGNLCALYQEVGDASDWWLVNATFVRDELADKSFVDHTTMTKDGMCKNDLVPLASFLFVSR